MSRVRWSASRAPSPALLSVLQAALDSAEAAQGNRALRPAMLLEVGTVGLQPGTYSVTIAAELDDANDGAVVRAAGAFKSTQTFELQDSFAAPLVYIPGGAKQGFRIEQASRNQ